jgi:hypothetical protein
MPHPGVTLLLAILLSAMLGSTGDRPARERLYHAMQVFVFAVAAVIGGSWLMFFIET